MTRKNLLLIVLSVFVIFSNNPLTANQRDASEVGEKSQVDMLTVLSTDGQYNSALIGNGEVVTTVGPTGYHNGFCPSGEHVNRTIFWAGRRMSDARTAKIRIPRVPPEELIGATIPLVRYGRFLRTLKIEGVETKDENWEQTADYDHGVVISTLKHGPIIEQTKSMVCLNYNMIVFHTRLENHSNESKRIEFILTYEFGDAEGLTATGTRLHIRRPHPDDRGAIIFPALPSSVKNARFDKLLADNSVAVSGEVRNGKVTALTAFSESAMSWRFRMPEKLAKKTKFADEVSLSKADANGLITVYCRLAKGATGLVK